jgi:hypothetical protein
MIRWIGRSAGDAQVSAAPPQPKLSPRITRMNANRNAEDSLLEFGEALECETSSCRFGSKGAWAQKRCEDALHSKSTSRARQAGSSKPCRHSRQLARFAGRKIFAKRGEFRLKQCSVLFRDQQFLDRAGSVFSGQPLSNAIIRGCSWPWRIIH